MYVQTKRKFDARHRHRRSSMISNDPLCCCEYLDIRQERNHILACCCNCQDLDEGFDSFISGRGVPDTNRIGLMRTLEDRCRIPWIGGARELKIGATPPALIILAFLLLASINYVWTVLSGSMMFIFLIYIRRRLIHNFPKSKFLYNWAISSFVILYILFEFVVISLLEILWEENIALTVLIAISFLCFWRVKSDNVPSEHLGRICNICQVQMPFDSEHVLWLDCCVGPHNKKYYLLGLVSTFIALLYNANLTLTSICLPQTVFGAILIPSDCSDVYDSFELQISFSSALYSFFIAEFILCTLIRFSLVLMLKHCLKSNRRYVFI